MEHRKSLGRAHRGRRFGTFNDFLEFYENIIDEQFKYFFAHIFFEMTKRTCKDCQSPITKGSKTGRCYPCAIRLVGKKNSVNVANQRFGKLIALESTKKRIGRAVIWKCKCDCGNIAEVRVSLLRNGHTRSCGCFRRERAAAGNAIDLTGRRFGKLIALIPTNKRSIMGIVWMCKCDCGNLTKVSTANLRRKNTTSCGCRNYPYLTIRGEKVRSQAEKNVLDALFLSESPYIYEPFQIFVPGHDSKYIPDVLVFPSPEARLAYLHATGENMRSPCFLEVKCGDYYNGNLRKAKTFGALVIGEDPREIDDFARMVIGSIC